MGGGPMENRGAMGGMPQLPSQAASLHWSLWLAFVSLVVALTGARKILPLGQSCVPEGKSPATAVPTPVCVPKVAVFLPTTDCTAPLAAFHAHLLKSQV